MYFRARWACLASLLAVAVCAWPAAAQPTPDQAAAVGFTDLVTRLGGAVPTGAGVPVTQVEVSVDVAPTYAPKLDHPEFAGKTITLKSGPSAKSDHATGVARNYYGTASFAPGITSIDVYEAENFLLSGSLNLLQPNAPVVETQRVQNHSWVANSLTTNQAIDALRRMDYQIQRDNVLSVAGVNNGSGSAFPQVLANAYNNIGVGLTSGASSKGPSTLDVSGRAAIDIVAPASSVSAAAPMVAGAAALLIESAGTNSDALKVQTIRASLLAGATKNEFDTTNQTPSTFDNWSRTSTQPLDLRYGAGELNINNSQRIISSPQQEANPTGLVNSTGWDFDNIPGGTNNLYFFDVPQYSEVDSLSIIAAWNRDIAFTPGTGGGAATFTPSLANVDLKLFNASSFTLGTMIDQSVSTIDNVEHIFQRNLQPGRYAIQLLAASTADVAIAWDALLDLLPVPGDGNGDRRVTGADFTIWSDNFGLFNGNADASHGDYNGDGFVTGADFTVWSDHFGIDASITSLSASAVVPEPATWAVGLLAAGAIPLLLRRRASSLRRPASPRGCSLPLSSTTSD